jgi:predicted dehydrogenase
MHPSGLSRRGFLSRSLAALTAAGLPAWYAERLLAQEQEKGAAKKVVANDKIRFGVIGSGDRFGGIQNVKQRHGLLGDIFRHEKQGFEFVATCDVDKSRREKTALTICGGDEAKAKDIAKYNDFRELLARKDIDAVFIVTPDHWHALTAIAAAKAGKDIYLEKPMTLTVAEGRPLIKAVRENKRILQVGSQQRSDRRFRLACELVRNGRIGKVHTVETRIGGISPKGPFQPSPVPEGLDWDFWLGQAPKTEFIKERCHYEFRWWYEYSGGKMTDWGAHHNDIAQWALGMDNAGPVGVASEGVADTRPNCYNVHSKFKVTYQYPNGTKLLCMSDGENGVLFKGEKGEIFVSRGTIRASDEKLLKEPLPADAVKLYESNDHMGNYFECLRSRKDPICPVEVGHHSVTVCHLGAISLRLGGKKLQWDGEKEAFVGENAEEGNKLVSREMRAPWKLEG